MLWMIAIACFGGSEEDERGDPADFDEGFADGCERAETEGYDLGYQDGLDCAEAGTSKCTTPSYYDEGDSAGYGDCYEPAYSEGHATGWAEACCDGC